MNGYIIGIDQSTQGTKALLFDEKAKLCARADMSHEQKINRQGHVSHDPQEIYRNTITVVKRLLEENNIPARMVRGIGISNQRETTAAWNRETGKSICDAIVWQCSRAENICRRLSQEQKEYVLTQTGIPASPYFPASKMAWILENVEGARELARSGKLCMGTIDSWLLFCMTGGVHKTDYSNASRTQLFNLHTLSWDQEICNLFQVPMECLPKVCDSNSLFGMTDLEGALPGPVPVHAVLGDSHGALFGQGCLEKGMVKATYGTGSSLMMNVGKEFVGSRHGIVTSLAWGIDGKVNYVLEGNLNYTGAVITWLKEDLQLITSAKETEQLAMEANQEDTTYLVPAFTGLGAPYWNSEARAMLYGMNRGCGRREIVKAALDCIAFQITDLLLAMENDTEMKIERLCVDGGPTTNRYLMQLQSDMAESTVYVPDAEELSGIGAGYLAGITLSLFTREQAFGNLTYSQFRPEMDTSLRRKKYQGWIDAVAKAL